MSVELDPREVLDNLYSLGYRNITPEQFKDFMKDLKKLIRHDQKKLERGVDSHRECGRYENPAPCKAAYPHPPDTFEYSGSTGVDVQGSRIPGHTCTCDKCECAAHRSNPTSSRRTDSEDCGPIHRPEFTKRENPLGEVHSCRGESFRAHPSPTLTSSSAASASYSPPRVRPCTSEPQSAAPSRLGCCTLESQSTAPPPKPAPPKNPPGSFIRPQGSVGQTQKCDPVALYHKYQSIWAKHPLPGEDPRANLRWSVRHRMMGPNQKQCTHEGTTQTENCQNPGRKIPCRRRVLLESDDFDTGRQEEEEDNDIVTAGIKDRPSKRRRILRVTTEVFI
ncbi:hypothetical protein AAG570_006641 [Ranatra chinensis]|uniref:Centriolar and ciliogenesis-associated protein HYLS1 C-terminal domain-containing protein n=1 Tax=Ranatra chinensis TaxID=642074 RepID=A0ABD0ZBL4_9HEMI